MHPVKIFVSTRTLLALAAAFLLTATASALTGAEIDAMLDAAHVQNNIEAAPPAADSEFLRRLSLDVRGIIPTIEESIAFLNDKSPDKRTEWTTKFLDSPERGENWGLYWDKVLVGTLDQPANPMAQRVVKGAWRNWVAEQFNANTPYDDFARAVISAEGEVFESPEAMPLARWRRAPENMAGTMSRVFLGTQIQCAQCHDHKTNPELTQKKFWEFAAFYGNTRVVPVPNSMMSDRPSLRVQDVGMKWEMEIPNSDPKETVIPRYLDGSPAMREVVDENGRALDEREMRSAMRELRVLRRARQEMKDNPSPEKIANLLDQTSVAHDTRRDQLASFMMRNDEELFAANMMNRLWARYFGRGFLEPVDDWNTGTEPVLPEILDALTSEFIASDFNIKRMETLILNTNAYRRSGTPTESSAKHPELFAHALLRPLGPEQLLDSLVRATNVQDADTGGGRRSAMRNLLLERYASQFVFTFDNDEMEWTSTFENSIPQALFLLNDDGINGAVSGTEGAMLSRIAATTSDLDKATDYLYLAALSRRPTAEEKQRILKVLQSAQATSDAELSRVAEDVFWALLNSTEFMTNH